MNVINKAREAEDTPPKEVNLKLLRDTKCRNHHTNFGNHKYCVSSSTGVFKGNNEVLLKSDSDEQLEVQDYQQNGLTNENAELKRRNYELFQLYECTQSLLKNQIEKCGTLSNQLAVQKVQHSIEKSRMTIMLEEKEKALRRAEMEKKILKKKLLSKYEFSESFRKNDRLFKRRMVSSASGEQLEGLRQILIENSRKPQKLRQCEEIQTRNGNEATQLVIMTGSEQHESETQEVLKSAPFC
ncbi:unnamed protein product [Orchesella dallaii]|uniref:Uncharacterized protein n=1 Tax=Orchesella dallaii TaxID=48710 RepID=A0ABP1PVM0_9HEXA